MTEPAKLTHRRPLPLNTFHYGATYYPEHWDAETMRDDAVLMREAGVNLVRMGEFAWHKFEPEEGRFDFAWLDEAIERLAKEGVHTMLCTPTATPPRWLTHAHPEVLRVDGDGRPMRHGSRQHASHFSPLFREYSRKITRVLAEHYADNPHVVGWQTDNELHCHFAEDHSPDTQVAFRDYLRDKYDDDIEALNHAWGADFWALAYQNFEQIETPIDQRPTHLNPSMVLDYHRFISWGVTRFQRDQVEILREANSGWWITHNGYFASIDYRGDFTRDLDFLSYDSYPFFDQDPASRRFSHAFNLDYMRAFSGHFIVPEQQAGPGGQTQYFHDTPEPGEMRRMALTSIAHGADGLLFFRWRTCRFGAEEYWCGLLDHDNVPKRRYDEAKRLGAELERLGPELLGSTVRIDVAVAGADYDSTYAHRALHFGLPGPRQASEAVHHVLHARNHAVGVVHPEDDLSGVKLYVIPHMPLFKPEWVPRLEQWVKAGGTLVIGPRCGTKDVNNHVIPEPLPGCLRTLTGTRVVEYGHQNRPDLRPLDLRLGEASLRSEHWYEELEALEGTEVIATWNSRFLTGRPAITGRTLGKGMVIHAGTWLTPELVDLLLDELRARKRLPEPFAVPEGIEVLERIRPDDTVLRFLINHSDASVTLRLPEPRRELLSGKSPQGESRMDPYDVWVFHLPRPPVS